MRTRQSPVRRDAVHDVEALLRLHPLHVLYKHSPTCGLSLLAAAQVQQFERDTPSLPVTTIDVHADRPLSDAIEAATGVRHESPQVLVVRDRAVTWHASHRRVTTDALHAAIVAAQGAPST